MNDIEKKLEARKIEVYKLIAEVEQDIETLKRNIEVAKCAIDSINCKDDIQKYIDKLNIEKGLQHINFD